MDEFRGVGSARPGAAIASLSRRDSDHAWNPLRSAALHGRKLKLAVTPGEPCVAAREAGRGQWKPAGASTIQFSGKVGCSQAVTNSRDGVDDKGLSAAGFGDASELGDTAVDGIVANGLASPAPANKVLT